MHWLLVFVAACGIEPELADLETVTRASATNPEIWIVPVTLKPIDPSLVLRGRDLASLCMSIGGAQCNQFEGCTMVQMSGGCDRSSIAGPQQMGCDAIVSSVCQPRS